jgi:hypothetical protein
MGNDSRDDERLDGRRTARGYAAPDDPPSSGPAGTETTVDAVPSDLPPPVAPEPRTVQSAPPAASQRESPHRDLPVNIEVVRTAGPPPVSDPMRRTLEVWTQNHVYVVDSGMGCIEVRDPVTGEILTDHDFLGRRLVGGQRNDEGNFELSCPFPRRGSSAVFESLKNERKRFTYTSTVDRVVIRLHVVTVPKDRVEPTWEEIAQAVK